MQNKILIAYYSQTGNTRRIAELIQRETHGIRYDIIPKQAYKSLYLGGGTRIKQERENEILPKLCLPLPNVQDCTLLFLGTPNWGNSLAHPVLAFLEQCDLTGTVIAPFCTHGGGGAGHIASDIQARCPQAQVLPVFETYGSGGPDAAEKLRIWIKGILK